jgi:hypothetical protein
MTTKKTIDKLIIGEICMNKTKERQFLNVVEQVLDNEERKLSGLITI